MNAEKEVEQFLLSFLKDTPFANKVYSVGGYNRDEFLGLDAKDLDIVVEMPGLLLFTERLTIFVNLLVLFMMNKGHRARCYSIVTERFLNTH